LFYVVLGVSMWAVRENRIRLSAVYLGLNLLFALALSPIGARVVLGLEHHANLAFGVQGIFLMDKVLRLLSIDFMSVGGSALTVNYQWMMVFALPLMLLYNRRRGPGVEWFFYAFYPAHIVALYGIGMALSGATRIGYARGRTDIGRCAPLCICVQLLRSAPQGRVSGPAGDPARP